MGWTDGDQFTRAARRGPKPEPWPLAEIIDAQDPSRPPEFDRPPLDRPPLDLPDNRAARRSGPFLRHNDLPWYGPIPNVGISSARSRHIHSTGGWPSPDLPHRTPVRVDVVPLIHMRARRAGWSARWSGAEILMQHWGVAPSTTCRRAALIAQLAELADNPRTPETGDGAPTGPPPLQQLDVPTSITPTRGPCHQAGALAGVSRASP